MQESLSPRKQDVTALWYAHESETIHVLLGYQLKCHEGSRDREIINHMYSALYKCVSLFCCKLRLRCNRVTFEENKMRWHSQGFTCGRSYFMLVNLYNYVSLGCSPFTSLCFSSSAVFPLLFAFMWAASSEDITLSER